MGASEKTATFVRELPTSDTGAHQRLYRLSEPLHGYGDDVADEFVVVSAIVAMFSGPETYIFPGNEAGEVTDWGELPGSFKGSLDHESALRGAGYTVVS